MEKIVLFIALAFFAFNGSGCNGNKEDAGKEATVKGETKKVQYPTSSTQLKKWINDAGKKAGKDELKKLEEFTGKFSAGEIIRGIAVRPKPDYWEKVSGKERLKTLSIMNTGFSKARIAAGYAEDVPALNSTLYIEDETEKIIAVSDSARGAQIL